MIVQGDVIYIPVDPKSFMDSGVMRSETFRNYLNTANVVERVVVAEGEATGHLHVVEGSILEATIGGQMLLRIRDGEISHPEHDPEPRAIPDGWYIVRRQRTYTPTEIRWVQD